MRFIYHLFNARGDTAAEKEFDIVIQMTQEYVLVQRFKKKRKWTKKQLLTNSYHCYKVGKFLWKNDLPKSLFWHKKNFESYSLKNIIIRGTYLEPIWTSLMRVFPKKVNGFQPLTIFTNKLHKKCSTRFLNRLCLWLNSKAIFQRCFKYLRKTNSIIDSSRDLPEL